MQLGDLDAAIADYCFLIQELECETADVHLARAHASCLASIQRSEFRTQARHDVERAIALAPDRPEPTPKHECAFWIKSTCWLKQKDG